MQSSPSPFNQIPISLRLPTGDLITRQPACAPPTAKDASSRFLKENKRKQTQINKQTNNNNNKKKTRNEWAQSVYNLDDINNQCKSASSNRYLREILGLECDLFLFWARIVTVPTRLKSKLETMTGGRNFISDRLEKWMKWIAVFLLELDWLCGSFTALRGRVSTSRN